MYMKIHINEHIGGILKVTEIIVTEVNVGKTWVTMAQVGAPQLCSAQALGVC